MMMFARYLPKIPIVFGCVWCLLVLQLNPPVVQAENRTFLWFSDLHLDPYYGTDRAVIHDKLNFGENCQSPHKLESHPYGDFGCDSPPQLLHSLLQSAAFLSEEVDFVLVTGDLVRHGNEELQPTPMMGTERILTNVSEMIRTYFPSTTASAPVVVSLGNNDITPDYYFDLDQPQEMLDMVSRGLAPLLEDDNQTYASQGGYYAFNATATLTILSLNTILFSTNRVPYHSVQKYPDPLGQFAWMEQELLMAQQSVPPRQVYIMGHIPPSIGSFRHTQLWDEFYLERYYALIQRFSEVVKAQLFGHIHTDEFRVHNIFPLFLTSSFTPIYGSNPSYRVVTYDSYSSELLDYQVYYLDLAELHDGNSDSDMPATPNWQPGQRFTAAYQVPDMSLQSLQTIVQDLQNSTDTSVYWEAFLTRLHVYTHGTEVCDGTCRKEWACTLSSMTLVQYNDCMGYVPLSVDRVLLIVVVILASIAGLVLALRSGKKFLHRRHYEIPDVLHRRHHPSYGPGEQQLPPLS